MYHLQRTVGTYWDHTMREATHCRVITQMCPFNVSKRGPVLSGTVPYPVQNHVHLWLCASLL